MIDDPEIKAIATAQRNKRLKTVGIVVAVIVVAALTILPSGSAVSAQLESDGHENVELERDGIFDFKYKSKKGGQSCSGRVTKMPGSSTQSGMCVTLKE